MKKTLAVMGTLLLFVSLLSAGTSVMTSPEEVLADSLDLQPKQVYSDEARLVVRILDAFHYKSIGLDDSLSSVIFDDYLEALDNNKSYFLASDIQNFERFRYQIDDLTKAGKLDPAYEIYNVFQKRFNERLQFVQDSLITYDFNYNLKESYDVDRSDDEWATSRNQLNDIWRKSVKNQALSLKISGKTNEEIVDIISKRYERFQKSFNQNNAEDVFELYMNALTSAYDPHTNYFSPISSDRFNQRMKLSLEGIGARLQTENDFTKVVQVLPGGPADKSDLVHEGDRIVGVAQGEDGEMVDVVGWRIDDVVNLIKGPKGTTVRLEILPVENGVNGPSKVITLVREKINLEDQKAKKEVISYEKNGKDYKMGVISIPSFYMDFEAYQKGDPNYTSTTRDVKRLISELQEEDIDGLMIDLRNNGGGSLTEAIDLTGLFIDEGPVVQVRSKSNNIEVGADQDREQLYDGPLTVLINRFSASASEIFAGAIQDYNRGIIIGEQSFGKGTVQSIVDLGKYLPDNDEEVGQLKLTLQKFYRVTGSSTQHKGVTPDIELPSAFSAEEFGESSNMSALPWDQIKATNYEPVRSIDRRLIQELNSEYQQRIKTDPNLISLLEEVSELKHNLENDLISLNIEERRAELNKVDDANKVLNEGEEIDIENKGRAQSDITDKILREGLYILATVVERNS